MSTFGEELRRERELRRISLREVSEATKISLRHLEALERNDFQHLPGGVFNRGFVRAYSQFIGVDPEVMVNAYLLEERAQDGQHPAHERRGGARGPMRPTSTPATATEDASRRRWGRLVAWSLVLLILIGALIGTLYYAYVIRTSAPAGGVGRQSVADAEPRAAVSTGVGHAGGKGEDGE